MIFVWEVSFGHYCLRSSAWKGLCVVCVRGVRLGELASKYLFENVGVMSEIGGSRDNFVWEGSLVDRLPGVV